MTVKMQLNWSNVGLHLDRRELSLLEYLIAWTIKDGHPVLGTTFAVHAHTKHFYCALSKKLSKISEPMITATQIV